MIRRPPRSTLDRSSAASDVYKRQGLAVAPGNQGSGVRLFAETLLKWNGLSDSVRLVAVSYTHLRAHETVLDLVCRLLLDTKKL